MTPTWTLALALNATLAPARADEIDLDIIRFELKNGLDVVLMPDGSAPIVHTQVWYHVGSKDEVAGRTGFAHLFEHLMFQGSRDAPGEYFTPIQRVGGDLNGTTNTERTNYYETVPAEQLPLALFMESDRMGHLLEALDQSKLDNQREVVRNERRQRYENPPYGTAYIELQDLLYPAGHPYQHTTIGSHADLEAATLDDVQGFFRTWYVPNNATLVVAGDFDPKAARKLVTENFGWIPRGEDPAHAQTDPVTLAAPAVKVVAAKVPDQKLWLAWHSPAIFAPGDAELDVIASALCSGKDSRLYQSLVQERQIARDVDCSQGSRRLGSTFVFTATAAQGHTTEEIATALREAVASLAADAPITADELAIAVTSARVGTLRSLSTIAGRAGAVSNYLDLLDRPDGWTMDLARYDALTLDAITATARSVFSQPYAELHFVPEAQGPAPTAPAAAGGAR
jgi:predicted Zn-dependent peptidase